MQRALWPAGIALAIAAESIGRPPLPALDAATGLALIALGLLASTARPRLQAGALMAACGFAWFLGTLTPWAVDLHRAPLALLIVTYPGARRHTRSWEQPLGLAALYGFALASPLAGQEELTVVFACALVAFAARRYSFSAGPERRARASALAAAAAYALVLIAGALLRGAGDGSDRAVLGAYDVVVLVITAGLFADLVSNRWATATLTALVVDLGSPVAAGTLRERLARTLGDPSLTIGYWLSERDGYVDEAGRPLPLPASGEIRALQRIDDGGQPLAVLIHDPAAVHDPELLADITAATRLAVDNARLQAQIRVSMEQVQSSRRRLVQAADDQRRQLELELRHGAARRLTRVEDLLTGTRLGMDDVDTSLQAARREVRDLARGIHPATLTDAGLPAALDDLAARSGLQVTLAIPPRRWPTPIEATAYFICSEALVNIAKHARARTAVIRITGTETDLRIEVTDDGVGGADPAAGSGLRGLADRAEALNGSLTITQPRGLGTRLTAQLPLPAPHAEDGESR